MSINLTQLQVGDKVQVVEYDHETGKPREGGDILPGTVAYIGSFIIAVRYDHLGTEDAFGRNTGWRTSDDFPTWRLAPAGHVL